MENRIKYSVMKIPFKIKNKMKDPGAGKLWILLIFLLVVGISSCEKEGDLPKYSPPADHTISKDGTMHKSGLDQPLTNCVNCHGADLTGGTTGVSCYECHGKQW